MAVSSLGGCITRTNIRLQLNVGHKRMGGCPGYRMEKRKRGQGRKLRKSLNASLMIGIMGWMSDQSDQYDRLLLTLILGTWTSNTINTHYFMPNECSRTVASCVKQCFPHFTVSRTTGSECIFWIHCSHAVLKIRRYSCKKKILIYTGKRYFRSFLRSVVLWGEVIIMIVNIMYRNHILKSRKRNSFLILTK